MIEYRWSYEIDNLIKIINANYIFKKDIIYFGYNTEKNIYELVYEK